MGHQAGCATPRARLHRSLKALADLFALDRIYNDIIFRCAPAPGWLAGRLAGCPRWFTAPRPQPPLPLGTTLSRSWLGWGAGGAGVCADRGVAACQRVRGELAGSAWVHGERAACPPCSPPRLPGCTAQERRLHRAGEGALVGPSAAPAAA